MKKRNSSHSSLVATAGAAMILTLNAVAAPAGQAPCAVPGDKPTIQAAADDFSCEPINLAAQTFFEEVVITRSLTLNGNGATIDGSGTDRPLEVDGRGTGGIVVSMSNLTLTNGKASGLPAQGGGMLVIGNAAGLTTVTATGMTVSNNIASDSAASGFGGGIAVRDDASLTLTQSTVTGNYGNSRTGFTGNGSGGGLYVNSTSGGTATLVVSSSTISGNRAANNPTSIGAGGGLRIQGDSVVTLTGNIWSGNIARVAGSHNGIGTETPADGGAIAVVTSTSEITLDVYGDRFINNIADTSNTDLNNSEYPRGGAVSIMVSNTTGKVTATFDGVTMTGNQAKGGSGTGEGRGGAIHARGATLIVRGSEIFDNRADSATVANDDGYGGGIYVREPSDRGAGDTDYVEVVNSMVADNISCNGVLPDCVGDGEQIHLNYSNGPQNSASLVHSTFAADTLNPHSAVHFNGPTAGDRFLILNSIVTDHAVGIHNVNATGYGRGRYNLYSGNTADKSGAAFPGDDPTTNIVGDPDFINPAGRDYHIGAVSAAIGLGRHEDVSVVGVNFPYLVTDDIDGEPRSGTPGAPVDSGTDEHSTAAIFADGFESGHALAWD